MVITTGILFATGNINLEYLFVLYFIGFLILYELFAASQLQPRWLKRLRWIVVLGLVVFGWIVYQKVIEILR